MYKEIGGNFWIDFYNIKNQNYDFVFEDIKHVEYEDIAYLSSGRGAIKYILNNLDIQNKSVLLPLYTCHTVFEQFIDSGYNVYYYNINNDLSVDLGDFNDKISNTKPSVILFHSYYGFDTLHSIKHNIQEIKNDGIIIIEDLTHSLFSDISLIDADYYVGSFRKWDAIPDGGFAISKSKKFLDKPIYTDKILICNKLNAFNAKYEYMENHIGNKVDFLEMYNEAEEIINNCNSFYKMSDEGKIILNYINKESLINKRRNNFTFLIDKLKDKYDILFDELPNGVVPLYFPIYSEDRDNLQKYLIMNDIYAPIIWPISNNIKDLVIELSNKIYDRILAIPCDQRYGVEEMGKIAEILLNF